MMFDFVITLLTTLHLDFFVEFDFMLRAWVACLSVSLSAAPLGVFLMLRRMSLTGDALSHAILPGAAIGYWVSGLSIAAMTLGGVVAGLSVMVFSGLIARNSVLKEDISLAVFYLLSLAIGVLIISIKGNQIDLLHILFGSVLALNDEALFLLGGVCTVTLLLLAILYRPLVLECMDPSFSRSVAKRWSAMAHYGFLVALVINLVAGFHALGTLLSVGCMIFPAAIARLWSRHVSLMVIIAMVVALLASSLGLIVSYHADLPSGPSIILVLGLFYVLSLLLGTQGLVRQRFFSSHHLKG